MPINLIVALFVVIFSATAVSGNGSPTSSDTPAVVPLAQADIPGCNPKLTEGLMTSTIRSAQEGNAWHEYILGTIYAGDSFPLCVSPNYEEARFWFALARKNGQPENPDFASYRERVAKQLSPEQIAAIEKRVAEWKPTPPPTRYFDCHPCSTRPSPDQDAIAALKVRAENGDLKAQTELGRLYWVQNWAEALRWYRMGADQGDAVSQSQIGRLYEEGWGVEKDDVEARNWYQRAADQGDQYAQARISEMYFDGRGGLKQDFVQSFVWRKRSGADNKALERITAKMTPEQISEAQNLVSEWERRYAVSVPPHASCFGDPLQDYTVKPKTDAQKLEQQKRLAELKEKANSGDIRIAYLLGSLYESGKVMTGAGLVEEAARWYRIAAEHGHSSAQSSLGRLYEDGRGVKQDREEAAKWFSKAAEQGDSGAQCELSQMYLRGDGVKQDDSEAYFWMSLAQTRGYTAEKYSAIKSAAANHLSAQQKEELQRKITIWTPTITLPK